MSDKLTIYHGMPSRPRFRRISTQYADVARHGAMWTPDKLTPTAAPWALDNGAFVAWQNDEEWSAQAWIDTIRRAERLINEERMPRPDFAVLPDVVGDARETYRRSEAYRRAVPREWEAYLAVQDGMEPGRAVRFADDLLCDGVFVGGTIEWKRRHAKEFVREAHARELDCHIARPSMPDGLLWARDIGADSVDLTTVVRNQSYHHLDALRSQAQLGASD